MNIPDREQHSVKHSMEKPSIGQDIHSEHITQKQTNEELPGNPEMDTVSRLNMRVGSDSWANPMINITSHFIQIE